MLQERQRLRQSVASQTLTLRPPEGVPTTAATVVLYNQDGTVLAVSAAATMPAVTTTLDGAVAAGADSITVDAITDMTPGQQLVLGDYASDVSEWVRIRTFDSATKIVKLWRQIRWAHTDAEAVSGVDLTISPADTDLGTLGDGYRALWSYTVGTARTRNTYFDIVADLFELQLTPGDLDTVISEAELYGELDTSVSDLIRFSERRIMDWLRQAQLLPDRVRFPEMFSYLGALGVRWAIAEQDAYVDENPFDERWNAEWERLMSSQAIWYDEDQDMVQDEDELQVGRIARPIPMFVRYRIDEP